jgi:uncharacterized protein YlxP (DUF503 family)
VALGLLTIRLRLPMCRSLKEKRSQLKPLLSRLGKEFNIAVAELDFQDRWQESLVGIAALSNQGSRTQSMLAKIPPWIERYYPQLMIVEHKIELW